MRSRTFSDASARIGGAPSPAKREVAPCNPLQILFGCAVGPRRLQPDEICPRLVKDISSLAMIQDRTMPATAGIATNAPCDLRLNSTDQQRKQWQRALSDNVQKLLHEILIILENVFEQNEKASKNGSKHLHEDAQELLEQFFNLDLPMLLVANLIELDFEVKKDVISIFSAIVRLSSQPWADQQIHEYAKCHPELCGLLIEGYSKPEVAVQCGIILRYCARQQHLAEPFFVNPDVVARLISIARHENFDISSDAFSSLHDLLLTHKTLSAAFLEKNFSDFFPLYNDLLLSDDYVTQRQALKLLSEILLDRSFMRVMIKYVGDEHYLQIHMNLLLADSKTIQFEAFQVLKIFIANPRKPPRVQQILYKNREKLLKLFNSLRPNKPDDKQFSKDMSTMLKLLQTMEPPPKAVATRAGLWIDGSRGCRANAVSTSAVQGPSLIMGT